MKGILQQPFDGYRPRTMKQTECSTNIVIGTFLLIGSINQCAFLNETFVSSKHAQFLTPSQGQSIFFSIFHPILSNLTDPEKSSKFRASCSLSKAEKMFKKHTSLSVAKKFHPSFWKKSSGSSRIVFMIFAQFNDWMPSE